ncbi:MAG: NADH-quinone oxidoreductase subunit J, partial [Candidatus Bathyarchaeia archaeon]
LFSEGGIHKMIVELLAVGLVISACLAVYLDEAVYSVSSLACMFALAAVLYALSGATFAAVFQLAVGAGTLLVLFLAGEILSEKPKGEKSLKNTFLIVIMALLLSLPPVFLSVSTPLANVSSGLPFAQTLWDLRAVDVILQGLVIVTVAMGIAIILYERKEEES